MFMFPEPPPLDYYITDISSSYSADGIFYHGRAAAGHKHIAKQLKPIKRTLRDPIAPPQELDSRTLSRILQKEKGGYVNPCGKDDGMVYDILKWMPKWKRKGREKFSFSTFPRSQQYELSHIRETQSKKSGKCKTTETKREEKEEEEIKTDKEPCDFLEPPIWWKGETGKPRALPVGNIDDYTFERAADRDHADMKISEKLHMDHPKKYIPGVIHRIKV
ncbi:uncharacterized protein LOC117600614 [Osmia lignaria lignaria]|uniref:uncharacterized protein LOC117600614 n=1 Tax=Osmia lignaria lignaria TaxID=1437193 RepID=UPI00402B2C79